MPLVYGNEEETGLLINHGDGEGFMEPYELAKTIERYIPKSVKYHNDFLSNGGKIYPDGSGDAVDGLTNIERTTPECSSPEELTHYIRSNEELLVHIVSNYVKEMSAQKNIEVEARIQRRVVDSYGNRKGCHDNYGLTLAGIKEVEYDRESALAPPILGHLATRSFITGAGFIKANSDVFYSQKIGGLEETKGYGYRGFMYRFDVADGERLEIRCNDINISDWAARARIGSTALALAIAQTPLKGRLPELAAHDDMYREAKLYNRCGSPTPEGSIQPSSYMRRALEYQRTIAELAITDLEAYTGPIGDDLEWAAHEQYQFCNDYEKVLNNEATIELLADRADWAAKLSKIHNERGAGHGTGGYTDVRSQYLDLTYDHISVKAQNGNLSKPKYGYGYKKRDSSQFAYTASERKVARGAVRPPEKTRAKARGDIIRNHEVSGVNWSAVTYFDKGVLKMANLENPSSSAPVGVWPIEEYDFRL